VKDPQFQANRTVVQVEYPGLGPVPVLAPPIRLSEGAAPWRGRPPCLGEHTREVLSDWLGLGPGEIEALRAANAL
jgi:crotonobetainyl-CoA:carnitine CoA-transferase CaiB-like acyl-CoA transferase